ncbi:putative methyltransferase [Allocatelliglobosispora scoriae]|uniref:Putative methyltransferase n=1 Tax=Allocatelliglobosispora scoriae TaxID=643052 RepID=A0A841BZD9_9ACTN|nr:fused MFS/spermidine synthase [Allocatelliglobosispora scoriae]MBB5872858.1 putative methyltransferase [Allocatelliglobosispora scoriae]
MTFLSDMPDGDGEVYRVDTGLAEFYADPHMPGAWTLVLDGMPQSHVNADDPTMIAFDYVRRIVDIIDTVAPPGPLRFLHLGGGGLTLPRCLAALRPGSEQRVVEIDGSLAGLVLARSPLEDDSITVTIGDALDALRPLPVGAFDVVIADIFTGARVPGHVRTSEFAQLAARAVDRDGCYIANIIDKSPLDFARGQAATLREVFNTVAIMADAAVLRGRRSGNLLLVGGDDIDLGGMVRRAATDPFPVRVEHGDRLTSFIKGRSRL